jgi:hypothetical protein
MKIVYIILYIILVLFIITGVAIGIWACIKYIPRNNNKTYTLNPNLSNVNSTSNINVNTSLLITSNVSPIIIASPTSNVNPTSNIDFKTSPPLTTLNVKQTETPIQLLLENTITLNVNNQPYVYSMILPTSNIQPAPIIMNTNNFYILYTSGFANPVAIQNYNPNLTKSYYIEQTLLQTLTSYPNDFIVGFAYNPNTQYLYYVLSNSTLPTTYNLNNITFDYTSNPNTAPINLSDSNANFYVYQLTSINNNNVSNLTLPYDNYYSYLPVPSNLHINYAGNISTSACTSISECIGECLIKDYANSNYEDSTANFITYDPTTNMCYYSEVTNTGTVTGDGPAGPISNQSISYWNGRTNN